MLGRVMLLCCAILRCAVTGAGYRGHPQAQVFASDVEGC
jgi:hypothetical protein